MRRTLLFCAALLATACAYAAPNEIRGTLTASHGWVKGPDGVKRSVKGMKFPFVARRVEAKKLDPLTLRGQEIKNPVGLDLNGLDFQGALDAQRAKESAEAEVEVYNAVGGDGYGYIEGNPSSLDDVAITSTGLGKPWTKLTFGFQYESSVFSNFLIRWRIWTTNIDNPAPQNDFSNEIADFGVIWNQSVVTGAYVVEIQVNQAAVVANDNQLYMATQFRDASNLQGEGQFRGDVSVIFNATIPVTVGSSLDQFWYDWDPQPDGAYENSEIDVFEGSLANIAYKIKVETTGSSFTIYPTIGTVTTGTIQSGDVIGTFFPLDGSTLVIKPDYRVARGAPVGVIDFTGVSPTKTPFAIRFNTRTLASIANVEQKIQMWDYVNSVWVNVHTRTIGQTAVELSESYGGTVPLANFVSSSNLVRARLTYRNLSSQIPRAWTMTTDQFNWVILR